MFALVRSCSKQPSSTDSPKRGGSARVCYPVCQFRCLLAETGSGMHVLGKGLLVIDEAGQIQMLISM